jgi:hypothetical protein
VNRPKGSKSAGKTGKTAPAAAGGSASADGAGAGAAAVEIDKPVLPPQKKARHDEAGSK